MAKHKKSSSGKVSNGGRKKANLLKEERRQRYFAKKRETGRAYEYKKNPYDPETQSGEYLTEQAKRAEKNGSRKTEFARLTSFFAKLDNYLLTEKLKAKEDKEKSNTNKKNK